MGRAHHSPERRIAGDRVFTPSWAAEDMVSHFRPTGLCMEPCRGDGAIYNLLPDGALWCELDEGRDFFAAFEEVDWIISNPPYSKTRPFMRHAFQLAANVVFLVPARNIFSGYGTVCEARAYGDTREIRWYGTGSRLGFPMGNAIAAFHWKRGYRGPTIHTFFDDGMSESMVERVARAIFYAKFHPDDHRNGAAFVKWEAWPEEREHCRLHARAALSAMRDVDNDILAAGYRAMFTDEWDGTQAPMMGAGWEAMIDSALQSDTGLNRGEGA